MFAAIKAEKKLAKIESLFSFLKQAKINGIQFKIKCNSESLLNVKFKKQIQFTLFPHKVYTVIFALLL